jgi:hypothetical protein
MGSYASGCPELCGEMHSRYTCRGGEIAKGQGFVYMFLDKHFDTLEAPTGERSHAGRAPYLVRCVRMIDLCAVANIDFTPGMDATGGQNMLLGYDWLRFNLSGLCLSAR